MACLLYTSKTTGETFKEQSLDTIEKELLMRQHAEEYGISLTDEEKQQAKDVYKRQTTMRSMSTIITIMMRTNMNIIITTMTASAAAATITTLSLIHI